MPSIAFGGTRSETSARVIHVATTPVDSLSPGVDALEVSDPENVDGVIDDACGTGIGRVAAAMLVGATEIRTTEPFVAVRVRAVVDRLLAARAEL